MDHLELPNRIEIIDPKLRQEIETSIDKTYAEVSKNFNTEPGEVYKLNICEQTAKTLRKILDSQGIETAIWNYSGWDITDHYFLEKPLPEIADSLVIDLNWQQFLDKPTPDLPKQLIILKSKLAENLTKFGVPKDKLHYWEKAMKLTI